MREVIALVSRIDFGNQAPFLVQLGLLELFRIQIGGKGGHGMVIHIEQGSCQKLGGGKALTVVPHLLDTVHQFLRHRLAGLVMLGVFLEHQGVQGPMLHHLRRQFHEIARHATQCLVRHIGKEAVQGMAELMEEGLGLVHAQHHRFIASSRRKVADNRGHRSKPLAVLAVGLFHIGSIPSPAGFLAGTGRHIQEEDTQHAAILVLAQISRRIGRGRLGIGQKLETDAVQALAEVENPVADIVHRQIGLQLVLVQRIFGLLDPVGVIPPVRRQESPFQAVLLLAELLHLRQLVLGPFQGIGPDFVQQRIDRLRILGHPGLQYIRSIIGESQQLGFLQTQFNQFLDDLAVVVLAPGLAARRIGIQYLLAEACVLHVLQKGHNRRIIQPERIALAACRFSLPGSPLQGIRRKTLQTAGILHIQGIIGRSQQEVLRKTATQLAQTGIDSLQRILRLGRKLRPAQHEVPVHVVQQLLLRRIGHIALLFEPFYPAEQEWVHIDLVALAAKHLHGLGFNLAQVLVRMRRRHIEKHRRSLVDQLPALLQSQHRVLESGFRAVTDNRLYSLILIFDSFLQSRQVILLLD